MPNLGVKTVAGSLVFQLNCSQVQISCKNQSNSGFSAAKSRKSGAQSQTLAKLSRPGKKWENGAKSGSRTRFQISWPNFGNLDEIVKIGVGITKIGPKFRISETKWVTDRLLVQPGSTRFNSSHVFCRKMAEFMQKSVEFWIFV